MQSVFMVGLHFRCLFYHIIPGKIGVGSISMCSVLSTKLGTKDNFVSSFWVVGATEKSFYCEHSGVGSRDQV